MKLFRVGGIVRDSLLDRQQKTVETDWLVIGESHQSMISAGFFKVGKHFPVYLHPETKEEYALARTERKVDSGHGGFSFNSGPEVSIQQDLIRRDLTINALAVPSHLPLEREHVIDLHGGLQDLDQRVLRHISAAFIEDPLRLFRVARFASQLHYLGFSIAPETKTMLKQVNQLDEPISRERIWIETSKAMASDYPQAYWTCLLESNALQRHMGWMVDGFAERMRRLTLAVKQGCSTSQRYLSLLLAKDADLEHLSELLSGISGEKSWLSKAQFQLRHMQLPASIESFSPTKTHIASYQNFQKRLQGLRKLPENDNQAIFALAWTNIFVQGQVEQDSAKVTDFLVVNFWQDSQALHRAQTMLKHFVHWKPDQGIKSWLLEQGEPKIYPHLIAWLQWKQMFDAEQIDET